MKRLFSTQLWDKIGITVSGLCALHCMFFPLALALLPLWPSLYEIHEWTHPLLFVLILPTVIFATRRIESIYIPVVLYSGLIIVAAAWLAHPVIGRLGEVVVTLVGSALLIYGHWQNYKIHSLEHQELEVYETA